LRATRMREPHTAHIHTHSYTHTRHTHTHTHTRADSRTRTYTTTRRSPPFHPRVASRAASGGDAGHLRYRIRHAGTSGEHVAGIHILVSLTTGAHSLPSYIPRTSRTRDRSINFDMKAA